MNLERIPVSQNATDDWLIARARVGDGRALEAVHARYAPALRRSCRRLLRDPHDVDDALQQTFLAAWLALRDPAADPPRNLEAWLTGIARHRCLAVLRQQAPPAPEDVDEVQVAEDVADAVDRRAALRALVEDVRDLPLAHRLPLVLAVVDGRSHAEIARATGLPAPRVKAAIFRARETLHEWRTGREASCATVAAELARDRGTALHRRWVQRHLATCAPCRVLEMPRLHSAPGTALPGGREAVGG